MSEPLLRTASLTVRYGGVTANDNLDIVVHPGQIVGLIGANGAGKTSFVEAITGYTPVSSGRVIFDGEDVTEWPPEDRSRAGLVRTFQTLELFDDLTLWDNLLVACEQTQARTFLKDLLSGGTAPAARRRATWALHVMGLTHLADRLPQELSHGQRKLAGVARALATRPRLLLLDEPAAGLDVHESAELSRVLRTLVSEGVTLFLIDHDMGLMLTVCDDVYVLDFGALVAHGPPSAIRHDPAVIAAYLGYAHEGPTSQATAREEPTR